MAKESKWSKENKQTNEIKFEIVERIGILREATEKRWALEVNAVAWNDGVPKVDIREWNEDHTKCGKGVSRFTDDEAKKLGECLIKVFE